jgi:hypothetical protein
MLIGRSSEVNVLSISDGADNPEVVNVQVSQILFDNPVVQVDGLIEPQGC